VLAWNVPTASTLTRLPGEELSGGVGIAHDALLFPQASRHPGTEMATTSGPGTLPKFVELDRHVVWPLKRLLINKRGRNLRASQAARWTRAWFHD
jgi:hypothetical protein